MSAESPYHLCMIYKDANPAAVQDLLAESPDSHFRFPARDRKKPYGVRNKS